MSWRRVRAEWALHWASRAIWRSALAALILLGGCATSTAPSPDLLRVGIAPDRPPLAQMAGSQVTGLEADFAHQLAADLGRRPELVVLPREELISALRAGQVDIVMSGLAVTPELAAQVVFTRPYLRSGQMALIRREDAERLGLRRALLETPLDVGFVRNSMAEPFVHERLPRAQPVALESVDAAVDALKEKRVDVFISDAPTVWRLSAGHREGWMVGLFRPLTDEPLAWAVAPRNLRLRTDINVIVRRWERTGVLEAFLNRWMPMRVRVR